MKRRQKKNPTSNLHVLLALRSRYLQNLPQAHLFFWQNNEGEYIKALPLLERQFLTPIPSCTGFKWEYMLGQCWVTPKDTSPCILLSSPGQEQEPGEEQNKHTVLLHTSSTSLDRNLLTQAQSSLNFCKTSQRETLPRKKTSQNYLLLLQKLTHFVWEICTAPHPYESVYTCTSSPSALFFNTSNKAKPAGNTDFPCHLQTIPEHPNDDLQPAGELPIYSHPLSYLCNNCVFMTGKLPYYVKGCSGEGSCLKPSWNLSTDCEPDLSTCLSRPAENSSIFLRHDF